MYPFKNDYHCKKCMSVAYFSITNDGGTRRTCAMCGNQYHIQDAILCTQKCKKQFKKCDNTQFLTNICVLIYLKKNVIIT